MSIGDDIRSGAPCRSDEARLTFAAEAGRTIYTFNARDFARLHREFLESRREPAGIAIIPEQRYAIGEKIRQLASFIQSTSTVWSKYLAELQVVRSTGVMAGHCG